MMRSLDIGATGMLAQQTNVEVISHNIANMNTTAFQRRRAEFQDLLYQNMRRVGSDSSDAQTTVPTGVQIGLGVKTAAVYRITETGNLVMTENPLDMAINGEGYFQVELPSGDTGYTRAGSFQLDDNGDIVTADGYVVQPGINIPEDAIDITVNKSGEIYYSQDGSTTLTNAGQLELAIFSNQGGLIALGDNLFQETDASGSASAGAPGADGYGTIEQGFLETSNVNAVEEVTNLITAQRAYEMNSKVIETSDQMLATLTNLR